MALWDRFVEIVNKAMQTEASTILSELRAACPQDTGTTAKSFRIMNADGSPQVGTPAKGLTRSVIVGSTLRTAYWSEYGNGGPNTIIYPKHKRRDGKTPMLGKHPDGIPGIGWRPYVHGYYDPQKQGFVKRVADRHR